MSQTQFNLVYLKIIFLSYPPIKMPATKKTSRFTKAVAPAATTAVVASATNAPVASTTTTTDATGIVAAPQERKKRRAKRATDAFTSYLYKIHRVQNGNVRISEKALRSLSAILSDNFHIISETSVNLALANKKRTVGEREVLAATRLRLQGDLCKFSTEAMTKVCANYSAAIAGRVAAAKVASDAAALALAPVV
jgi:histone H3/H4